MKFIESNIIYYFIKNKYLSLLKNILVTIKKNESNKV